MKTIIVATDFSPISINAAYYAVELAAAVQAEVLLMNAVAIPLFVSEAPIPAETFETMLDDADKDLKQLQEKLVIFSNNTVTINYRSILGTLVTDLEDLSSSMDVFAIVMGTQGAGATDMVLFGSNTISAMRNLPVPIIIVPKHARYKVISNIGLACDLKDVTETLPIKTITSILTLFNSKLHVFYVSRTEHDKASMLPESISLQNNLMKFHPEIHFLVNEDIEEGIFEAAEKEYIDLLMIVPKEHGLIYSVFHKSISKDIATHPRIPIMTIHGK
ncbi:MAG: universal stress protein [Flavipsychrobacter sp.]